MVASQEALASKVGLEILKQGGNAAVAVGFTLAVTLPRSGNFGVDLCYLPKNSIK